MNVKLRGIIYAIVLVAINMIYFMFGGADRASYEWLAYGFIMGSIIISFCAILSCINYKRVPDNLITLDLATWLYSIASLIINTIFILINFSNIKIILVINMLLLGLFIIVYSINMSVNNAIERNLGDLEADKHFVKNVSDKLKIIMDIAQGETIKNKIEMAYDTVRTAPVKSNSRAMEYEIKIISLVEAVEQKIEQQDFANAEQLLGDILINIKKRNNCL